jgi:UPF0755 protein
MDRDTNDILIIKRNRIKKPLLWVATAFLFLIIIFQFLTRAPKTSQDLFIKVNKNQNPTLVFQELKDKKAIKSINVLKTCLKIIDSKGGIKAGNYLIKKDSPAYQIARQLNDGIYNIKPIKVFIREGLSNEKTAEILATKINDFNQELFLEKANEYEGYLFPDTYFFYPREEEEEIIKIMVDNFEKKTKDLSVLMKNSDREEKDIITMASILEGEASGQDDIYLISGILWKRLDKNMMLQVDVDRRTYEQAGLPDKPISNPGLLSIKASLSPVSSDYYYYLHDKDGQVHFAKNYDEHRRYIDKYLKN